jgi:transcriptional regulator with XRE-family HTH domain
MHMAILSNADVAAKVRGVAAEKRTTQADLAAVLHTSPMAVSRRMTGATPFTPEELIAIARHFGVSVATFFGERGEVAA